MSDSPEQRASDRREIEKLHPGERFQMMLGESDTPETDAEADLAHNVALDWDSRDSVDEKPVVVHVDFARRLERERDEKIADIQKAADERADALGLSVEVALGITHSTACTEETPCVRCQRDELRARVAELEGALNEMTKNRDTVLQRLLDQSK